jgi:hypothetical protein
MAKRANSVSSVELVVRRGALRRFQKLKEKTAALPVKVLWDRRKGERRSAASQSDAGRRKTDRRQKPPFTWELSDFVVVGAPEATARRRKTGSKAVH